MNAVSLAMISDEGFVMPTVVTLQSIKDNKAPGTLYRCHVFLSQCGKESRTMLLSLEREDFLILITDLDKTGKYSQFSREELAATPAALYKFDLAALLPDLDKVLYLDGDLIVQKDLYNLYSLDLGGRYAAVVKDMQPMVSAMPHTQYLRLKHLAYFNSGVMLLNLKRMRQEDTYSKLLEYKRDKINKYMDQDALNAVFQEDVLYISFYYNVGFRTVENFPVETVTAYYEIPMVQDRGDFYDKAAILHLASPYKPWKYETPVLTGLFLRYYEHTPYAGIPLKLDKAVPPQIKMTTGESTLPASKSNRALYVCPTANALFHILVMRMLLPPQAPCDILIPDTPDMVVWRDRVRKAGVFDNILLSPTSGRERFRCALAAWQGDKARFESGLAEIYLDPALCTGKPMANTYSDYYYPTGDPYWQLYYYNQIKNGFSAQVHMIDRDIRVISGWHKAAENSMGFISKMYGKNTFLRNIVDYHAYNPSFAAKTDKPVLPIPSPVINRDVLARVMDIVFPAAAIPDEKFILIKGNPEEEQACLLLYSLCNMPGTMPMAVLPQSKPGPGSPVLPGAPPAEDTLLPWEAYLWHGQDHLARKRLLGFSSGGILTGILAFGMKNTVVLLDRLVPATTSCGLWDLSTGIITMLKARADSTGTVLYAPERRQTLDEVIRYLNMRFDAPED